MVACTDATGPGPAARVVVSPDSTVVLRGGTLAFTAAVLDANGRPTNGIVTWTSSDTAVVAVGSAGIGVARSAGVAWVRASVTAIGDSARVQVCNGPFHVAIVPTTLLVRRGDTVRVTALATDSAGQQCNGLLATWGIADTTVARISAAGLITGFKEATTRLSLTVGGYWAYTGLLVYGPVSSITFGRDTLPIVPGAAVFDWPIVRDSADVLPRDHATWTTSDPSVATISTNGDTIRAVGLGTATITGTADGQTGSLVVHVRTASLRDLGGWFWPCGLGTDSIASCWSGYGVGWGEDSAAQPSVTAPAALAGRIRFIAVQSADAFGCGLAADSTAWCWGWTGNGRLGNPAIPLNTYTHAPVPVQTTMRFRAITATARHTCALGTDGAAYCWGAWGGSSAATTPLPFTAPAPFVELSAGDHFTCGVTADSSAYCWGYNYYGALGTGDSTNRSTPALVAGGLKWVWISAGAHVACGLVAGGHAYCWGGAGGQLLLGTDSLAQSPVPVPVKTSVQFTQLATGGEGANHTCGLTGTGIAYCWGDNSVGEIGDGSTAAAVFPTVVTGGLQWQSITASTYQTCGVSTGGVAYCWGSNFRWTLADGTEINRWVPTRVLGQP